MSAAHDEEPKHPYHLVSPNVWPMVGALGGGLMTFGGVLWMHGEDLLGFIDEWVFFFGTLIVIATMVFWWRDVIRESVVEKMHTPVVQLGLRYGMLLFITSEVMFFVAFFWSYFDPAIFPDEAIQETRVEVLGGVWPPEGILTFDPFAVPLLNTLILLLSGCTITWSHHCLLMGDRKNMIGALALTVFLGLSFTGFQIYEYATAAFTFDQNVYSSVFYMATGFHGFHVIVGTTFLIVCLFRAMAGHFTREKHNGFEAAAWYWHFVDVVWLFLFICVYWWGGGDHHIH
ncbi:MAG: cytochrome c oxidase subunit 3 [Rhodospirillales bacterium]|nr:cytochrome c oxidase subunit 3 [Rhodospirillales bacterium]